jgi:hypothetical protein
MFRQVSWLCFAGSEVIHSGATARDSHPLPYSPRFYAGHLNVSERTTELVFRHVGGQYHADDILVKAAMSAETTCRYFAHDEPLK